MSKVILQPMSKNPKSEDGYIPSRIRPPKTISEAEFLERYADYPCIITVDVNDHSMETTAYSHGLDCWHVVTDTAE